MNIQQEWVRRLLGGTAIVSLMGTLLLSFFAFEIPGWLWGLDVFLLLGAFVYYTLSQNLVTYVAKRVFEAIITLLVIATLTFLLVRFIPGGPFDQEKALPPEVIANIEAKYKLNEPLYMQYWYYVSGIVQGDFGESYKYLGRNVTDIISESLPHSVQLGVFAMIICYLLGIPLGLMAAAKHNTPTDNLIMIVAISGVALPSFLVAAIAIYFFAIKLGWFPPALWDGPMYYILPMIVLGIRPASIIARMTRASVLEVITSDYIRTARSKGLNERTILYKHVLKNSLIPVLTFSGPLVSGMLTGSFIIEQIFAIPGIGKHLIQSVTNRDYPLILGATLLFSAALVLANLVVDLLYSFFDPRINLS